MCGISLILHNDGRPVSAEALGRMNKALGHRGPDGQGTLLRGAAGLGHTRLSIVDIQGGAQPMTTADGRYAISYNGELYNYRTLRRQLEAEGEPFASQSDTEVLLNLYHRHGPQCLDRLRGMFAFAVLDDRSGSLFMARDRLGIKPLFYHWDGRTLVAASEIKALFASGLVEPRFDPHSIRNYFRYQFQVAPFTPFAGIRELPPGHRLTLRPGGKPRVTPYWDLEFPREGEYESMDEGYWLQAFESALDQAVDSHTIGDVPIGAYLSGGIDSSAVAHYLRRHYGEPLRTFSIHFTNPAMDESPAYRRIAEHLGVGNTELTMEDDRPTGFMDDLGRCLYHLEQPQRLAVDIPHLALSGLVRGNGYKVVYTGDGADEILAGYDSFRQDAMRIWGNEQPHFSARKRLYLNEFSQYFAPDYLHLLLRLHRREAQRRTIRRFGCYPAWFDFWHILDGASAGLFSADFEAADGDNRQMQRLARQMKPHLAGRHPLNQSLYIETKTRLPGWILWKSDRLSMANSVEARVPFMDHPLVELAARMPPPLKLNGMNEKYALKAVALPHLPPLPDEYKKRGFYTPIREWFFSRAHRDETRPYLTKEALEAAGVFQPQQVQRLLQRLQDEPPTGDMNAQYRTLQTEWALMGVLSVQVLHRLFVAKEAPCFHDIP